MRNKKGQFIKTTGNTKYKKVQYRGRVMQEHQRVFCIILGLDFIPKGLIIHHIDKDKMNNDIDNLSLMTITAHNRIHSHKPWNKGIKASENKKWREILQKALKTRSHGYVTKKGEEVYKLKSEGLSFRQIAKKLAIHRTTASHRYYAYKSYKKLIKE